MAPKPSEAALKKKWEKEQLRKRVLEYHAEGKWSHREIGLKPDVKLGKSSVTAIINNFGKKGDVQAKKQPGRPSKITKRCASCCF
jgi:hypothetical protein